MLIKKGISIVKTSEARKEKFEAEAAWELFRDATCVVINKGKKVIEFTPNDSNCQEILELALGRSKTLRAPTLKINNKFIVGFSEENYENL